MAAPRTRLQSRATLYGYALGFTTSMRRLLRGVGRRIRFLRTGLDYVPLSRDYILAREGADRGGEGARQRYADLRRTRDKLHQEFGRSWALNVPLLVKIGH